MIGHKTSNFIYTIAFAIIYTMITFAIVLTFYLGGAFAYAQLLQLQFAVYSLHNGNDQLQIKAEQYYTDNS